MSSAAGDDGRGLEACREIAADYPGNSVVAALMSGQAPPPRRKPSPPSRLAIARAAVRRLVAADPAITAIALAQAAGVSWPTAARWKAALAPTGTPSPRPPVGAADLNRYTGGAAPR